MNARKQPPLSSAAAAASGAAVRADLVFEVLPGNIGHLVLRSFEDPGLPQRFAASFERISATAALVVDLRLARGGGNTQAWQILAWLMDKPFNAVRWMGPACVLVRRRLPFAAAGRPGEGAAGTAWQVRPAYPRPLAVLIGGHTEGAAEDFAVTVENARRGLLWGEPTGAHKGRPGVQPQRLLRARTAGHDQGPDMLLWAAREALLHQVGPKQAVPAIGASGLAGLPDRSEEHPARGFDALGVDPAGVGRQQRGHDAADVVGQAHPA